MNNLNVTKDKMIFISGSLISLLIIICSISLFLISIRNVKPQDNKSVKEPQIVEEVIAPKEISYKDTEIKVLNGTGVKGTAKAFSEKLTKLGYNKVTTANYDTIITGNLLFAPTDFGKDINLLDYKFETSNEIKIVIGKTKTN